MKHDIESHATWRVVFIWILIALAQAGSAQSWLDNTNFVSNDSQTENIRRSEHFRIAWGKQPITPLTEEFVQLNLQHFEYMYKKLNGAAPYGLALYSPSLKKPSDGNNYRFDLWVSNTRGDTGGAFATAWQSAEGLGEMACDVSAMAVSDPPSFTLEHEYSHPVTIGPAGGGLTGEWGEGTANWCGIQVQDNAYMPLLFNEAWLAVPHGKEMYWNDVFLETLLEEPNFGAPAIAGWIGNGGNSKYIFNTLAEQVTWTPDRYDAIKNVVGRMAAKSAGVDFKRRDQILKNFSDDPRTRYCWPLTEAGSTNWYRIAWEQAPGQAGYNLIPLTAAANTTVTVQFRGVCNPMRGSDWRACLVAVSGNGDSRYSSFWNAGSNSMKLSSDETLYLAVAATPDFFNFGFERDMPFNVIKEPMAYEFALTNATITEPSNGSSSGLVPVPNGGGYRAATATVAGTAYVGPNARVLGSASVTGNARIEDYAVVQDSAEVRDSAVVSGHALVFGSGQVSGFAKVRDWATVSGQVSGNARVYDHAKIYNPASMIENTSAKGNACWYDGALSGYAIADGDCDDGSTLDHGTSTGWSWGPNQNFNDGLPGTGGLFAQFNFERPNAAYATDTYGMAWGYLMGGPICSALTDVSRGSVLNLDGTSQYIECPRNFNDVKDTTIAVWVKWAGGANDQRIFSFGDGANKYMYLTPCDSAFGKFKFVISTNGSSAEQSLVGPAAISPNRWTHLAVSFSGNTSVLYVDGATVATNTSMTLNPDDLNSKNTLFAPHGNYIGRGNAGDYFAGSIDDFRLYSTVQTATVISAVAAQFTDRSARSLTSVPAPTMLWYKFDETSGAIAADSSGAGKSGTVTSGMWTAGRLNNCVQLNGTSSRVTVPSLGAGVPAFTITTWVNVGSIPGGSSWAAAALAATDNWSAGDLIAEFIGTGGGNAAGRLQFAVNNSFEMYSNAKFDLASGNQSTWIHLALVYDSVGGSARIYLNGVLDNSSIAMPQTAALSLLKIGSWAGTSRFFAGKVDDFRVYNRALSATEIALFMPGDTAPPSPGTPTWLRLPTAAGERSITMSATKAADASGVLYYFACTAGAGHSSGWITSNQYSDNGLAPGAAYAYTVQTKDGIGNIGAVSAPQSATTWATVTTPPTPNPATFATAPKGVNATAITMTASKGTSPTGLVEYRFTRISGAGGVANSGWQASPTYTFSNLTSGNSYTYNVQMRDGNGNAGSVSATSAAAIARDDMPPFISGANNLPVGTVFSTRPYVRPDATLYMAARAAADASGVQYYFHCSSGGGPDSGWQDSRVWSTATPVADGTYTYQIKIRDNSAQRNETAFMGDETFSVTVKNVYHTYVLSQLAALPDECLVNFSDGTVASVQASYYVVTNGSASIHVMPNTLNSVTDGSLLNRLVNVKGGLWTYGALGRTVTFAEISKLLKTYTITASAGAHGSINPSGTFQVAEGTNLTVNLTPDSGYVVDNITVDGVVRGIGGSYTLSNVTGNHTISATFRVDNNPSQLVYYPFDESSGGAAADASGHGRDGELEGGSRWIPGRYNNALDWDGTNGSLTLPSLGTDLAQCTLATWIKVRSLPPGAGWQATSLLSSDGWSGGCLALLLLGSNSGTHAGQVQVSVNGAPGNDLVWSRTNFASLLNTWVHLAAVYTPSGARVYINGALDASASFSTAQTVNVSALKLGSWGGGLRFFNGQMDDLRFYSKALSATEISNLFAGGATYTIAAIAGAGGSISPSGGVLVSFSASQMFTITPDNGYRIAGVMVDNVSQGTLNAYTFPNVTTNHTIAASFVPAIPPTLSITSDGTSGLVISWPDAYGGQLLWTPRLDSAANWQPVDATPVHSGGLYKVSVTPGPGPVFYGLGE